MQIKYLITLGLSLSLGATQAQTVFTVGKENVSKTEFLDWYKKNNVQNLKYDKASLDNFVNLYALYKMKVMEANVSQMDTIPNLKSDIEMYKGQLAKNYVSTKGLTESLAKEAYERMKFERKVSHIMLSGYGDQMDAQNKRKLDSLSSEINSGKLTFDKAAELFSTDRGTAAKGGNIGFINAFQTPYIFESTVYSTPVGKISTPFKSPYGYHIVKVTQERPASGIYEVAQILLSANPSNQDDKIAKINLAKEIKAKAESGTSFESLVKQYSQDDFSKDKGGVIKPVSAGSTDEIVEQTVFSLKNLGDISEPIVTNYGVHLFKLLKKTPLGSYEQEHDNLIAKVEKSRADELKERNLTAVKNELGYKEYPSALEGVIRAVNQEDFNKGNTLGDYPYLTATMIELGGKKYSQQDFLTFVRSVTRGFLNGQKENVFTSLYKMYNESLITEAQIANLEKSNPEYKKMASEYRNGVLIFDMMDKNIWSKANQDTTGLFAFYDKNANNYQWKPGFDGVVFQSKNHEALQQIQTALASGLSVEDALAKVNTPASDEKIYKQTGRFEFDNMKSVDRAAVKSKVVTGIIALDKENEVVILADEIYNTPQKKTFVEARDIVVDDYQKQLEKDWNDSLKKKYPVKVNTAVLNSMVK